MIFHCFQRLHAADNASNRCYYAVTGAILQFFAFHLMPWDRLPADFDQKYDSAWTWLPNSLYDPRHGVELYNRYLDELVLAEHLGFDGVCVNEHHQNAYGLMPSPQLMASTLARRTRNASILLLGQSLALYDPPTRVAEEMAMIDCISGGRLIAGFPVGTPMDTCYAYGQNPAQLRDRYYEGIDLVLQHIPGAADPLAESHDWYVLLEWSSTRPRRST